MHATHAMHAMPDAHPKRPAWFIALTVVLLLWAIAGVASFVAHGVVGEQMAAAQGEADLAFHRALPGWFAWDYALATLAALGGAVALLMRSRHATGLYALSLLGVLIQFGYVFLATDLLARKGAAATLPFPLFIAVMACVQIAVARRAARRGWVG